MRIMIVIIAALASFTATAQEVCDASLARGGWIIEAPYLGASCVGVMEPLTDDKAIAMFECGNELGGSQPVGQAKIEYAENGAGCVMYLEIGSYARTLHDGHNMDPEAPIVHWDCAYCDDSYDPRIDTLNLETACEVQGLNLAEQNGYTLINTIVVAGYRPPGDTTHVIEQSAICGWTYSRPGGTTTYTPAYTSATCRDAFGAAVPAGGCFGTPREEWIDSYAHISARVPMVEGDSVTQDIDARVTTGQPPNALHMTTGNTVTLTRTTPAVAD